MNLLIQRPVYEGQGFLRQIVSYEYRVHFLSPGARLVLEPDERVMEVTQSND